MYTVDATAKINRIFLKLERKNPKQLRIIYNKIKEILENPYHFKPLRGDMHGARRVHIDKSFVLVYEINERNKTVTLLDYGHHDNIYK